MAQQQLIFEGTEKNFDSLVIENSFKGPVMVNYWAAWAGPCLKLYPELESLVKDYAGRFILVNVDTEAEKKLARENAINSLPTVKIYLKGQVVDSIHGAFSAAEFKKSIDRLLSTDTSQVVQQALELYQQGEHEQALSLLAKAALDDPENLQIPITLGRLLLATGRHEEAYSVLFALPAQIRQQPEINALIVHLELQRAAQQADPIEKLELKLSQQVDDCGTRLQYAALSLLNDDCETAMQQLLHILKTDRDFSDDIGRRGLLALFHLLANQQPSLVERYRGYLSNELH